MIKQKNVYSKIILLKPYITILKVEEKLLVKGPLGSLFLILPANIFFEKKDFGFQLYSSINNQNLVLTYYQLLSQKTRGVELGFFEILLINGIGWWVSIEKNILKFSLGYSHSIQYFLRSGIEVIIYDKQRFKVFGLDLTKVEQVVADLCKLRSFNIYKGKGIYKQGHVFQLKVSSKSKA